MLLKRSLILLFLLLSSSFTHARVISTPVNAESITVFVSPDSSYVALDEFLRSANHSIYINTYTFTSDSIALTLANISKSNKSVVVILEGSPVGGLPEKEANVIEILKNSNALVYFSEEEFRFNHAKYAVIDNSSVLITTENFGESGFPVDNRDGNRGWGAIIISRELGERFSELFYQDLSKAKNASLKEKKIVKDEKREGVMIEYAPKFKIERYSGNFTVIPVIAPENNAALEAVLQFLSSANKSIKGEIFYAYKYWGRGKNASVETAPNLFLEELIKAAERGVDVKLLLDSTWYNVDEKDPRSNYYTREYLNNLGVSKNISLVAKLLDKSTGLEKLHTKGVVIDSKAVLISSMNWNENSPKNNREVGVIIYGEPAKYYEEVFEYDWKGGGRRIINENLLEKRSLIIALLISFAFLAGFIVWKKRKKS